MDTNSKLIEEIQTDFKCREVQIQKIFHFLNIPNDETNNIIVYGPRSTGKSTIVRSIMNRFQVPHVWIDSLNYVNTKMVYESILKQTANMIAENYVNEVSYLKRDFRCQNSVVFFEKLTSLLEKFLDYLDEHSAMIKEPYESKFCLIFDNFEHLIKNDNQDLCYVLKNLSTLMNARISISIFYIAQHSVEWFGRIYDFEMSCFQVVFNNYSKEELLSILLSSKVPESQLIYGRSFYNDYVDLIFHDLNPVTKNLVELKDICLRNFDLYTLPIRNGEMTPNESSRLYLRFQNRLQELIEFICDHKTTRLRASTELSKSMSYLLVACYLASHNSSKQDKRYFVKNQGRKISRKRKHKMNQNDGVELRPPKAFTFERLFNIYQALINLNEMDDNIRNVLFLDSTFQVQFTELIKQNLISIYGTFSIDSSSKYQLSDVVTLKYIQDVSSNIELQFKAFLEES